MTDAITSVTTAAGVQRIPRRWLAIHAGSLVLVAAVLVVAARGQWFFYDEWDFLAERAEWDLLAPHNGHLSIFPQLMTTLVKSVVGLHSYWPFLALTIVAHLVVIHMLWRLMMRASVHPAIAVAITAAFGVIVPGTENTLWAFQVGFITPIATGMGALLLALRPELRNRELIGISVLLLVGVGFASTGIPIAFAVLLAVLVRHGWRAALVPTIAFALVYGAWYLAFARGTTGADGFGVQSAADVFAAVPAYMAHAFVDGLGKILPLSSFAPAVLVAIAVGAVMDIRRTGARTLSPVYWPVIGAFTFAALTAFTRVGLGVESASTGRYVYVYAALLAPLVGRLLSQLAGTRRSALAVICALVVIVGAYNAAGTIEEGRTQAALEQTVKRTISAALTLDDGDTDLDTRTPAAMVAPTLTMADIRAFVARGQFEPVPFDDVDLLSARVNLLLTATPVAGNAPSSCRDEADGWIDVDLSEDVVVAPEAGTIDVIANEGAVQSFGTRTSLDAGVNELSGLGPTVRVRLEATALGGVCVGPRD